MKKEVFEKIIETLDKLIQQCETHFGGMHTKGDFMQLTMQDYFALKAFAQSQQSKMDSVAREDLYHILGAEDITPPELVTIVYRVRKYLSYRSVVKLFAISSPCNYTKLDEPIVSAAVYELKAFGKQQINMY